MPYKDKQKQREAEKAYRLRNKEKVKETIDSRLKKNIDWYINLKRNSICSICGFSGKEHYYVLSFHHLNPESKVNKITNMVYQGYSLESIKKEMNKCQILCENCHRKQKEVVRDVTKYNQGRLERLAWFSEFKKSCMCENCGETDIRCLDFHHIEKNEKEFGIGVLANGNYSVEVIIGELSKCMCLCANCHRIVHQT